MNTTNDDFEFYNKEDIKFIENVLEKPRGSLYNNHPLSPLYKNSNAMEERLVQRISYCYKKIAK
ncbi:MAG TPA: hypothetical protein VFK40_14015 [Nitrososphaeraceae archaeon]|nr:hypothetical protein [Nitrososphaeraceae archaeon]